MHMLYICTAHTLYMYMFKVYMYFSTSEIIGVSVPSYVYNAWNQDTLTETMMPQKAGHLLLS